MSEQEFVGYFDGPGKTEPAFDPGFDVLCPICLRLLSKPISKPRTTISLMAVGGKKSYFYRAHKACYEGASEAEISEIESAIIDAEMGKP